MFNGEHDVEGFFAVVGAVVVTRRGKVCRESRMKESRKKRTPM